MIISIKLGKLNACKHAKADEVPYSAVYKRVARDDCVRTVRCIHLGVVRGHGRARVCAYIEVYKGCTAIKPPGVGFVPHKNPPPSKRRIAAMILRDALNLG